MLNQSRALVATVLLIMSLSSVVSLSKAQDGAVVSRVTDQERALLAEYKGDVVIPDALLRAYSTFIADTTEATEDKLKTHCLPNSVQITTGSRPPEKRWYGRDMNIPFLRSNEFYPQITSARAEGNDCYQLRTGSSGVYFVETRSGKWKIYSYFDKPIQ